MSTIPIPETPADVHGLPPVHPGCRVLSVKRAMNVYGRAVLGGDPIAPHLAFVLSRVLGLVVAVAGPAGFEAKKETLNPEL